MGHYDDIIEEQETAARQAEADAAGRTYDEQWEYEVHCRKMAEGKRLYDDQQATQAKISYYVTNRDKNSTT